MAALNPNWKRSTRAIVASIGMLFLLLTIVSGSTPPPGKTAPAPKPRAEKPKPLPKPAPKPREPQPEPAPLIDYKVVKQVTDEIVLIAVDPVNRNENDMKTLGSQLHDNYASGDFARVSVYDDEKAAELWDKIVDDTATPEEENFYDQHYIAQYNKNKNTGLDQFFYFLQGPNGPTVTINY